MAKGQQTTLKKIMYMHMSLKGGVRGQIRRQYPFYSPYSCLFSLIYECSPSIRSAIQSTMTTVKICKFLGDKVKKC